MTIKLLVVCSVSKRILIYIVVFQIVIIGVIAVNIFRKQEVLGVVVDPINKEDVIATKSGNLKGYYTLKPNRLIVKDLSKMGDKYKYSVTYNINSDGFNQMNDYELLKAKDTFRIMTLGASFTFGANVVTADNYPSQLEKLLNDQCRGTYKYEVFNLGVGGYDIIYSLNRFNEDGLKYSPDLVVWYLTGSDFLRINERKKGYGVVLKDEELAISQRYNLRKIGETFKGKVVFVASSVLPWQYKNILKNIPKVMSSASIYLDSPDINSEHEVFPDNHPTKRGYYLIAENILNHIIEDRILPCKD